jgi:hypothetical protein
MRQAKYKTGGSDKYSRQVAELATAAKLKLYSSLVIERAGRRGSNRQPNNEAEQNRPEDDGPHSEDNAEIQHEHPTHKRASL